MTDIEGAVEKAKAGILPFESWERLSLESSAAFAAFCVYRDFGADRNIRKAIASIEKDASALARRYRTWRNYAAEYHWTERATDYDRYIEGLKQTEVRKTIEARGEKHREVTGKMLDVVSKKLDTMNPADLTHGAVSEWVQTAIKSEREACQFADANCLGVSTSRNSTQKQGELNFVTDFQGL